MKFNKTAESKLLCPCGFMNAKQYIGERHSRKKYEIYKAMTYAVTVSSCQLAN